MATAFRGVRPAENGFAAALAHLRSTGVSRLSCVGGRDVARQLLTEGLVDDLYLTTSPQAGGDPNTPLLLRPLAGPVLVRKAGTGTETGVIFEHVRLSDHD
jgi:riboflavin biosynthesis pyrimidine reductase